MEGVMGNEAVEGLARAMPESWEPFWYETGNEDVRDGMREVTFSRPRFAEAVLALRADPAAARAVVREIDPDGLRAAAQAVLEELDIIRAHREKSGTGYLIVHIDTHADLRRAIEGTPDAD